MIGSISIILFTVSVVSFSLEHNYCKNLKSHKNYHLLPTREECGFVYVCGRIMGGKNAEIGEFPWMVILMKEDRSGNKTMFCGGSVISKKYILTAAHCLTQFEDLNEENIYKLVARVGEYDLSRKDECQTLVQGCEFTHVDIDVEEFIIHEKYFTEMQNDLALIRVKGHIRFNKLVSPICLPTSCKTRNDHFINTSMAVAGWGNNNEDNGEDTRYTDVLQRIYLHGVLSSVCQESYYTHRITSKQFCAGGGVAGDFGKDSCHGDSGGPVMLLDVLGDSPAYDVVGIVSVGPDCTTDWSRHRNPGIYTRVGVFVEWILDHIRD